MAAEIEFPGYLSDCLISHSLQELILNNQQLQVLHQTIERTPEQLIEWREKRRINPIEGFVGAFLIKPDKTIYLSQRIESEPYGWGIPIMGKVRKYELFLLALERERNEEIRGITVITHPKLRYLVDRIFTTPDRREQSHSIITVYGIEIAQNDNPQLTEEALSEGIGDLQPFRPSEIIQSDYLLGSDPMNRIIDLDKRILSLTFS